MHFLYVLVTVIVTILASGFAVTVTSFVNVALTVVVVVIPTVLMVLLVTGNQVGRGLDLVMLRGTL